MRGLVSPGCPLGQCALPGDSLPVRGRSHQACRRGTLCTSCCSRGRAGTDGKSPPRALLRPHVPWPQGPEQCRVASYLTAAAWPGGAASCPGRRDGPHPPHSRGSGLGHPSSLGLMCPPQSRVMAEPSRRGSVWPEWANPFRTPCSQSTPVQPRPCACLGGSGAGSPGWIGGGRSGGTEGVCQKPQRRACLGSLWVGGWVGLSAQTQRETR